MNATCINYCFDFHCFSYEFNVYQDDEDLTNYFILMTIDFFQECNVR